MKKLPTLEEFMAQTGHPHNGYVREPGFQSLYVRRSLMPGLRGDLEIANLSVAQLGIGTLTDALDRWEARWSILFECVQHPRFAAYLERRGYVRYPEGVRDEARMDDSAPTFIKWRTP